MSATLETTLFELWETKYKKLILAQLENPFQTEDQKKFLDLKEPYSNLFPKAQPTDKPRMLHIKTPFHRDEKEISEFEKLFETHKAKKPKEATYALLIANFHHLQEYLTQPLADRRGFIRYLIGKYTMSDKILKNIKIILDECLPSGYIELGMEKRMQFNQNLPHEKFDSPSIQALIKEGYEVVMVDIKVMKVKYRKTTQSEIPKDYKTFRGNCILVDNQLKNVLAVLHHKKISDKNLNALNELIAIQSKSIWGTSRRGNVSGSLVTTAKAKLDLAKSDSSKSDEIKKKAEAEYQKLAKRVMNGGSQVTLGLNNFHGMTSFTLSSATTTNEQSRKLWSFVFNPLANEIYPSYRSTFPKNYSCALTIAKELIHENPDNLFSVNCPFSTVSLNRSNAVKPHRDFNAHNISAMIVAVYNEKQSSDAGTCFLEWFDPKTGLPIELIVNHGDLLLANTDYVHIARNTKEGDGRYSLVYYIHKRLVARPIFACEDSDIDEEQYEDKLEDDDIDVDMKVAKERVLGSVTSELVHSSLKRSGKRSFDEMNSSNFSNFSNSGEASSNASNAFNSASSSSSSASSSSSSSSSSSNSANSAMSIDSYECYVKETEIGSLCFRFKPKKSANQKEEQEEAMPPLLISSISNSTAPNAKKLKN